MKNKFTITISDVKGSKSYSFNQLIRKFFLYLALFIIFLLASGVITILWLNQEVIEAEQKMAAANVEYINVLEKQQQSHFILDNKNKAIQYELDDKLKQLTFLNQTLEGIEDLIGFEHQQDLLIEDRIKLVQLSTLEKKIMLTEIPNGIPVKNFQGVTSPFGWRTHPVRGGRHFHRGIDYRGKKGAPIIATANGIVEFAGFKENGFGKQIIIAHNHGFKTLYAHMSKLYVKTGQVVTKGEVIAGIGSTGVSSGNHLHYEVRFLHKRLDPANFVKWSLQDYYQIFKEVKEVPWGSLTQRVQKNVQMVEKQLLLRDVK